MPIDVSTLPARSVVPDSPAGPATNSTSGSRYTGLKGCATRICEGLDAPCCSSLGLYPEVDDAMTASGRASSCTSARTACLSARSSGTLSCTHSASATASARFGVNSTLPSAGIAKSASAGSDRRALSSTAPMRLAVSGCGSNTATSQPCNTNLAAQPPPMTPPPMIAALRRSAS